MVKRLGLVVVLVLLVVAAPAEALSWLGKHEAAQQIRKWGRNSADENGDTITRQLVKLCVRSSPVRLRCWYEEDGFDVDGYDYLCWGDVRVIEYRTHYNIAPIRHGRFRFRCEH
jgi:hypothetical protein